MVMTRYSATPEGKRDILLRRGVPEKFVSDIVTLASTDNILAWRFIVLLFSGVTFLGGALIAFLVFKSAIVAWLYGRQAYTADLFAGAPDGFLIAWFLVSATVISVLTVFILLMMSMADPDTPQKRLRTIAFAISYLGDKPLDNVIANPRWPALSNLPSAEAFLNEAGVKTPPSAPEARARNIAKTRNLILATVAVWAVISLGIVGLARGTYTRIAGSTIEYKTPGEHFMLPLSQVSRVEAYCRRRKDSSYVAYVLTFKGHSLDLLSANLLTVGSWTDVLDRIKAVDDELKAARVPMRKLAAYDQLDAGTRTCLDQETNLAGYPRKAQLIFAQPAG